MKVNRTARGRAAAPVEGDARPETPEADLCLVRAAGKLGHALRNPLTAIKAGTQLVRHLTRPTGEIAEYFDTILSESARLERLAARIGQLARLEAGPPETLRLDALFAALEERLGPAAHDKGVRLRAVGLGAKRVRARRELLEAALFELVDNAVGCTAAGAAVTLRATRAGAAAIALAVDGGCAGIDPARAARLFEPFHSPEGRAGLGLNIAERAALLGATPLSWENRRGGGCRFALALASEGG